MNEKELIEIWQSVDKVAKKEIDFEQLQRNISTVRGKLRRKIKWDISLNVLVYILLIPAFILMPRILYLAPFLALIWAWYLWELLRIFKYENKGFENEDTKTYLKDKKKFLENYIFRTRLILYLTTPFFAIGGLSLYLSLQVILSKPFLTLMLILFSEILISIICETYVRMLYIPTIKKLKQLLAQFEE